MKYAKTVKYTLEAIETVKKNALVAKQNGDYMLYNQLMGDLYTLEYCLVGETKKLIAELESAQEVTIAA